MGIKDADWSGSKLNRSWVHSIEWRNADHNTNDELDRVNAWTGSNHLKKPGGDKNPSVPGRFRGINHSYFTKDKTEDKIVKHQVLALQGAFGTRKSNHTSRIYQGPDSRSIYQAIIRNRFYKLKDRIMGKEHGKVFTSLKGCVEINNGGRIPVSKELAVPGY